MTSVVHADDETLVLDDLATLLSGRGITVLAVATNRPAAGCRSGHSYLGLGPADELWPVERVASPTPGFGWHPGQANP